jgi:hypothetical protein
LDRLLSAAEKLQFRELQIVASKEGNSLYFPAFENKQPVKMSSKFETEVVSTFTAKRVEYVENGLVKLFPV